MDLNNVFVGRIINYDELIFKSEAIIEAAKMMGLPKYLISLWVEQYLIHNVRLNMKQGGSHGARTEDIQV